MSSSLFHRRRVERLAQLLDESTGRPRHHARSTLDGELAGYVRLGDALVRTAGVQASPTTEFRTSLRAMLVATAEREGIGATAVDDDLPENGGKRARVRGPVVGSKRARGAVLVGLAAGTLALSGMSAASGSAMPGDPLYGVKRSTESARLALAGSDVSRGQLRLNFAHNRLAEAHSTGARGPVLAGMLNDMDNETRAGVKLLTTAALSRRDRGALDVIDAFVRGQHTHLVQLGDSTRVLQSMALLDRITLRSAGLRTNLGCGTGNVEADDLGAVTPTCTEANPDTPRTGSGQSPAHRPETAPNGAGGIPAAPGAPAVPGASPSSSGLLDNLGRLIGSGH
jgi:hypothetical protein